MILRNALIKRLKDTMKLSVPTEVTNLWSPKYRQTSRIIYVPEKEVFVIGHEPRFDFEIFYGDFRDTNQKHFYLSQFDKDVNDLCEAVADEWEIYEARVLRHLSTMSPSIDLWENYLKLKDSGVSGVVDVVTDREFHKAYYDKEGVQNRKNKMELRYDHEAQTLTIIENPYSDKPTIDSVIEIKPKAISGVSRLFRRWEQLYEIKVKRTNKSIAHYFDFTLPH